MTGVQMPNQDVDGESLVPLLKSDEEFSRDFICWHYPHYSPQGGKPTSAIRGGDWKLILNYETNKVELYNLKEDIGETNDLAETNPEKTQELESKLNEWLNEVDASMPLTKQ